MTSNNVDVRPNCQEILDMQNKWLLNNDEFNKIENLEDLHLRNQTVFLEIATHILHQPLENYSELIFTVEIKEIIFFNKNFKIYS
jgi:hypothetical protein